MPTFAPQATSGNVFDEIAYGTGGAVGGGLAMEGIGAVADATEVANAIGDLATAAATLGDGAEGASRRSSRRHEAAFSSEKARRVPPERPAAADGAGSFAADAHPTFAPGPTPGASCPLARQLRSFHYRRTNCHKRDHWLATGCHTCGTKAPGTMSGNAIPDHQPVSALNFYQNQPQVHDATLFAVQHRSGSSCVAGTSRIEEESVMNKSVRVAPPNSFVIVMDLGTAKKLDVPRVIVGRADVVGTPSCIAIRTLASIDSRDVDLSD